MNSGQRTLQTDRLAAGLSAHQIEKLEILSMDLGELKAFLDSEQLSNPMLEVPDLVMPGPERSGGGAGTTYGGDTGAGAGAGAGTGSGELYELSDEDSVTLTEYLTSQLSSRELKREEAAAVVRIMQYLDADTGYLTGSEQEIEEETGLSPTQIRFGVQYIRGLEPAGVGARDLADCLCLQLERQGLLNEELRAIIERHMPDIASGHISRISRELGISTQRVRDDIARIRSLDPRPGSRFGQSRTVYVVPDARADYENGSWNIEILGVRLGSIHINRTYEKIAREAENPELIAYFSEKIARAREILSAIEQRENTLKDLLRMALETQTDFALGRGPVRHLTQKEAADHLQVHPSTVNRAVKNKYIQLPAGTMEIRRLFSAKVDKAPEDSAKAGRKDQEKSADILTSPAGQDAPMDEPGTEICLIAPTQALLEQNRRICSYYEKKIDGYLGSVTRKAIEVARARQERGAKVFISRRGTKKMLEEAGLTVVEIPVLIADYIPVMERARMARGPVAFFSYGVTPADIRSLCMLLEIDARFYSYYDIDECGSSVARAIEEGAVLGIGGADTSYPAEKAGLPYVTIENSEQALLAAIESAEQLLAVMKAEQERQKELSIRLQRYEMSFGFTHDAIIGVDREGRIEVLNTEAEKFFPVTGKSVIGAELKRLLPEADVSGVLQTGRREIDRLIRIHKNMVSMNCVPIVADGNIYGAVATLQDVRTIQKNEQKIRMKLNQKGLTARYHFEDIIGHSESVRAAVRIARKFANSGATVMIHGETGTGKEMFAQSIHNASGRASGPFVAVNCGSLPKDILEAELFGYVEGAFTGALKGGKTGLFEMAHGGTIFLDEIGEMPLSTQVQMLRVLQEKEIRRVGSDKVTPVDIRVIAATHRDLAEAVRAGDFREDLYYRLNILNIEIPPLRDRGDDVLEIGLSIYSGLGTHDAEDASVLTEILSDLRDYPWPGNIRELSNMMERIHVLRSQGETFDFICQYDRMYRIVKDKREKDERECAVEADEGSAPDIAAEAVEEDSTMPALQTGAKERREIRRIVEALNRHDLEITAAAEDLGMSRSTLWRKMKKYNIDVH
ncbi:MAG: sigma 54-interacting transcriptional regulator [Lachnospiraceae bacterium]|nr:sigma 54-interacting transcriptional regulator [Lachnospiraceae bacterium]